MLTLDSIDDFARYSDDGLQETDERITGIYALLHVTFISSELVLPLLGK